MGQVQGGKDGREARGWPNIRKGMAFNAFLSLLSTTVDQSKFYKHGLLEAAVEFPRGISAAMT